MTNQKQYVDLSTFKVDPSFRGRSPFKVQLWWLIQELLVRTSPQFMYGWRRFWWSLFGANIGDGVIIRPSAKVTYPWKVTIGDYAWIGDHVELYSLAPITIGNHAVVSQHSYLCAGTHDYTKTNFPLVGKSIVIEDQVWIAAGCFISPGVTIGRGSIIASKSVVLKDMPKGMICVGHPAKAVRTR